MSFKMISRNQKKSIYSRGFMENICSLLLLHFTGIDSAYITFSTIFYRKYHFDISSNDTVIDVNISVKYSLSFLYVLVRKLSRISVSAVVYIPFLLNVMSALIMVFINLPSSYFVKTNFGWHNPI